MPCRGHKNHQYACPKTLGANEVANSHVPKVQCGQTVLGYSHIPVMFIKVDHMGGLLSNLGISLSCFCNYASEACGQYGSHSSWAKKRRDEFALSSTFNDSY